MSIARQPGTSRLTVNIIWNYFSGIASIIGLLLLYPLSVGAAGAEAYGLWVLSFGAIQLFTLADFGLGTGIVRNLSAIQPGNLRHQERKYFVTVGQAAFLVLGMLLTALYAGLFPLYLSLVTIPEHLKDSVSMIIGVSAASLFLSIMGRCANSILWAEDRPDIERKASVVALLFRAGGIIAVLFFNGGLLGVVLIEAVSIALPSLVCIIGVLNRYGRPRYSRISFVNHLGPLLRLSGVLFVGTFASVAAMQLPLYVVGGSLGLTSTTAFGALLRVLQSTKLAVSWLSNPFTHAIVNGGRASSRRAAVKCFQLTSAIAVLCAVPLAFLPDQILEIWLGDDFILAGPSLALIAVAVLANGLILPSALVTNLRANPWPTSIMGLIILVLTAIGVTIGASTGTLFWATFGMVLPLALLAPGYYFLATRVFDLRIRSNEVGRAIVLAATSAVLCFVTFIFVDPLSGFMAVVTYALTAGALVIAGLLVAKKL